MRPKITWRRAAIDWPGSAKASAATALPPCAAIAAAHARTWASRSSCGSSRGAARAKRINAVSGTNVCSSKAASSTGLPRAAA